MGYRRKRNEYKETSNRRTHKIIHIKEVTSCCLNCAIRARRNYYCIIENSRRKTKFPSWKLTSKNAKQWEWKKCRIKIIDKVHVIYKEFIW